MIFRNSRMMVNVLTVIAVMLAAAGGAFAQAEETPIAEKRLAYKNWTYKDVRTGEPRELRTLLAGKKLVMVVYFAPWCPDWRHDAPTVEKFYEKYKNAGFGVIGIGEYGSAAAMRGNLENLKISFPAVYESEGTADRRATEHYRLRTAAGDKRDWGSPWYVFIEPQKISAGDELTSAADVINGQMIEAATEKYIREKLTLPAEKAYEAADK